MSTVGTIHAGALTVDDAAPAMVHDTAAEHQQKRRRVDDIIGDARLSSSPVYDQPVRSRARSLDSSIGRLLR